MTAIQVRQALAVVVDTSPVVNFARAGALRPLAQYLGTRAIITADVFAELADWAKTYSPIASLLGQAPWSEPAELSPELTQKVVDILGFVSERGSAPYAQDLGEVTCVVLAQDLRDSGLVVPVLLLDDVAHGKNLARPRDLDVVDTPGPTIEMVLEEVITEPLGGGSGELASLTGRSGQRSRRGSKRQADREEKVYYVPVPRRGGWTRTCPRGTSAARLLSITGA